MAALIAGIITEIVIAIGESLASSAFIGEVITTVGAGAVDLVTSEAGIAALASVTELTPEVVEAGLTIPAKFAPFIETAAGAAKVVGNTASTVRAGYSGVKAGYDYYHGRLGDGDTDTVGTEETT